MTPNMLVNTFKDLPLENAKKIHKLLKGKLLKNKSCSLKEGARILREINTLIEGFGVEYMVETKCEYINTGDVYNATILFSEEKQKFYIGCQADFIKIH